MTLLHLLLLLPFSLKYKVGYIPGFTSFNGYQKAIRQTQQYKEALLNGMGYSSRSETQQFAPKNIKKLNEVKDVPADVTKYYTGILGRFIGKPAGYGWRQYKKLVQSAE